MDVQKKKNRFGVIGNDQRNLGGRIEIVQHLKNHHKHLLNTKARLNTRKPPMKHISKRAKMSGKGKRKLKNAYEMENVVQSFKKVATMKKGYVDSSAPKSMKVKKLRKPGRYKNQKKFIKSEHERNLKILNKKIKGVGKSMKERKKNPHDPVAYPVRFMRRDPLDPMTGKVADKMGIGIENLATKIINRRDMFEVDNKGLLEVSIKKSKYNSWSNPYEDEPELKKEKVMQEEEEERKETDYRDE